MSRELDFDTLKEKAFKTAKNHGWHEEAQPDEVLLASEEWKGVADG